MALDTSGAANRKSPRRGFKRPIGLLVGGSYQVVQASQIGEGGILIQGDLSLDKDVLTLVTILLDNGGFVVTRAKVLYKVKKPAGKRTSLGMEFVDLPLTSKRLIRNYVAAKTEFEMESELDELTSN